MTRSTTKSRWLVLAVCVFVPACGGSSGSPPSASPSAPALQVGGTYAITKSITDNTCDDSRAAFTGSGTVAHSAGASTFTLNDTFRDFPGSLAPNGSFTVSPQMGVQHLGAPVTISFESGRFTATGFEAQVRLDINGPLGQPPFAVCRVGQAWRGTKQGTPNVIP